MKQEESGIGILALSTRQIPVINIQIPVCLCYVHPSVKRLRLAFEVRNVLKLSNNEKFKLEISVSEETKLP